MKGGDCYPLAFRAVTEGTVDYLVPSDLPKEFGTPRLELVHGFPIGTGGDAKGKKFCHAWIEVVLDAPGCPGESFVYSVIDVGSFENDPPRMLPEFVYYKVGQIQRSECRRYTADEAAELALKYEHYGPWHELPKGTCYANDDGTEGKA